MKAVAASAVWSYGIWILLTWTATAEQLLFGAAVSIVVGWSLASLGPTVAPWQLLDPRRLAGLAGLTIDSARRIVLANVALTRLIWGPRSNLRTGMIVVPTKVSGDGALAGVGLVTSLIVDNQLVDLDRSRSRLQYHAVRVPPPDAEQRYAQVNGPTERYLGAIAGERP